jgi:hypothetical protein
MLAVRDDLIVPLDGVDLQALLEFWRWLIPVSLRPLFATALGDLFLQDEEGAVWWLDVGAGTLETIAANNDQFQDSLRDSEKVSYWFGERFVDDLRASGLTLKPGECYSYLMPPITGGRYEPGNFRIHDVVTHFQVWGPIHESLKDIPDGTTIEFVVKNAPGRNNPST